MTRWASMGTGQVGRTELARWGGQAWAGWLNRAGKGLGQA